MMVPIAVGIKNATADATGATKYLNIVFFLIIDYSSLKELDKPNEPADIRAGGPALFC